MIVGERIRSRLREVGLSQSELARRVGVSQPMVNSLIRGATRSTTQLHRIARELGTTPAYLSGEVDDPDLDAPVEPALTPVQSELVELFEAMDGTDRAALLQVARSMRRGSGKADSGGSAVTDDADAGAQQASSAPTYREFTLPVLFPPEYALTRMFEALLAMVDPTAPAEEQARLLARTLPIGLSQLRDLLPPPAPADHEDASPVRPKTLAEPR